MQLRGEPGGPASDIYSLGIILCELLTGAPSLMQPDSALRNYRLAAVLLDNMNREHRPIDTDAKTFLNERRATRKLLCWRFLSRS
jgi:serine/threonine protein kinase